MRRAAGLLLSALSFIYAVQNVNENPLKNRHGRPTVWQSGIATGNSAMSELAGRDSEKP
jgi:hypothetical protein